MTGRVKVGVTIALGGSVIFALGALLWVNRPFQAQLGTYSTSLADRTASQRHNILKAVVALDGVIIEPGGTFSFNDVVGPRVPERGYLEAAAFMERDLVTSFGGGICQVSSTLYNAAALSGLSVVERHPHFRRVASVPPGRDSTVWYGVADLKLRNQFLHPVRMSLGIEKEGLQVTFQGGFVNSARSMVITEPLFVSKLGWQSFRTIRVVETHGKSRIEVLSIDSYRI